MPPRKPFFDSVLQQASDSLTTLFAIAIGAVAVYYFILKSKRPPRGPGSGGAVTPGSANERRVRDNTNAAANQHVNHTNRNDHTNASANSSGGSKAGQASAGVLQVIKGTSLAGCKVCLAWNVLHDGQQWLEGAEKVLQTFAAKQEVFVMCRVSEGDKEQREAEKKTIRALVHQNSPSIPYVNILFCTTAKGFEAFTRQLNPSVLVTFDTHQASFLSGVLPYIVLVDGAEKVEKPNVACIKTVAELLS